MKYLILILVVIVVLWWARGQRTKIPPSVRPGPPAQPAEKETMLACAHCGLHLPRGEALPGRGGVFCGEAHRAAYEKAHPAA